MLDHFPLPSLLLRNKKATLLREQRFVIIVKRQTATMKLPCCLVSDAGQPVLFTNDRRRQAANAAAAAASMSPVRGHFSAKRNNAKTSATASWVGLALLLTSVFSDPSHNDREHDSAISKSISTFTAPSALYELASFMALEENAEEEGIATFFDTHAQNTNPTSTATVADHQRLVPQSPRGVSGATTSAAHSGAACSHRILGAKVTVRDTLQNGGCLSRPAFVPHRATTKRSVTPAAALSSASTTSVVSQQQSSAALHTVGGVNTLASIKSTTVQDGLSSASSSSSTGGLTHHAGEAWSSADSSNGSHRSATPPDSPDLLPNRHAGRGGALWEQVHVMDLAQEIGNEAFVHNTAALLRRSLFPTIYRCFVEDIEVGSNAHLQPPPLSPSGAPTTTPTPNTNSTYSSWCCGGCRKWHHTVREACLRCQQPNPNVHKLFLGQLRKELPCDDLLEKIVFATTSNANGEAGITPLRVEGHSLPSHQQQRGSHVHHHPQQAGGTTAAPARRGKGCGSVYVLPADAERLVHLLHRNVFVDVDWSTGREVIYFAYSEQRMWFEEFVSARIMQAGDARSTCLPNKPVVCEIAAAAAAVSPAPMHHHHQHHVARNTTTRPFMQTTYAPLGQSISNGAAAMSRHFNSPSMASQGAVMHTAAVRYW